MFKVGDIVIITDKRIHSGERGLIVKKHTDINFSNNRPRWIVILIDSDIKTRFIYYENELKLDIKYLREQKLKLLGI